jgi:hypothetical protein
MTYAIRVVDSYAWIVGRHVDEGQSVMPGAPIMDIMTPDGVVETIISEGWGIVAHIEGKKILHVNTNVCEDEKGDHLCGDGGSEMIHFNRDMSSVYGRDSVVCHIVARSDRSQVGAGLRPRPSQSLRMRRMGALAPR